MKNYLHILLFLFVMTASVSHAQVNSDCLIAYYPFDGNTLDQSGHLNNATNHGATLSAGYLGNQNSAYELSGNTSMNGSNIYIEIPELVDSLNRLTISLWVKQNSYCYYQYGEAYISFGTLAAMGTVSTSIYYDKNTSDIRFVIMTDSGTFSCATPFQSSWIGNFQHFAMVYDQGKGMLWAYHNGSLVASLNTVVGRVKTIGNYGAIGKHWWANAAGHSTRINGVFDEVKIYSCALDSLQILALYTSMDKVLAKESRIMIYPNPTSDHVTLEFAHVQSGMLRISNMAGKQLIQTDIKNSDRVILNTKDLDAGVYLIGFTPYNGKRQQYSKLIIQR